MVALLCRSWSKYFCFFFFSSRRRHTRCSRDWSSDVCSSDLPKRADLLLPATIVLRSIMERLDLDELTVSDKAIREGLLYDFIERHRDGIQAEQEIPNVRRRNVMYLARRCQSEAVNAHHDSKRSLQPFDQTATIHKMGAREREWLEYAAILHDIGYLIQSRQHHN